MLFFQMDMHELIEEQMKKQLKDNFGKSRQINITKKPTNRFMGLFSIIK